MNFRLNNFAHVNYSLENNLIGKLLCLNGAGIQYKWIKNILKYDSYEQMNHVASNVSIGSDNLLIYPYGNGAERVFNNQVIGTNILNVDLNNTSNKHIVRATIEGIAFSFIYGLELLENDNFKSTLFRAGNDNLFQSVVFSQTISVLSDKEIEIYNTTGAYGATELRVLIKIIWLIVQAYNQVQIIFIQFHLKVMKKRNILMLIISGKKN